MTATGVGGAIGLGLFLLLLAGAMSLDWNGPDRSGHPPPWQWDQGAASKDQGVRHHER